jgi:hypothetical protein
MESCCNHLLAHCRPSLHRCTRDQGGVDLMFKAISLALLPVIYLAIAVATRTAIVVWGMPVPDVVLAERAKAKNGPPLPRDKSFNVHARHPERNDEPMEDPNNHSGNGARGDGGGGGGGGVIAGTDQPLDDDASEKRARVHKHHHRRNHLSSNRRGSTIV